MFWWWSFFNQGEKEWRTVIIAFIERISEDKFELDGFPIAETNYPAVCYFERNNSNIFSKRFYIGW